MNASAEEIARIRAKIATRKGCEDPTCPGWAVFNAEDDPTLDVCVDCWAGSFRHFYIDELESLPEAQRELALAETYLILEKDDGGGYVNASAVPPCLCGCVVGHAMPPGAITCSGCGERRTHPHCCKKLMRRCATGACWHCDECHDTHLCGSNALRGDRVVCASVLCCFSGVSRSIYTAALAAMDRAEEIGGPEEGECDALMREIEEEAHRRVEIHAKKCGWRE